MLEFWKNSVVQLCLRIYSRLEVIFICSLKQTAVKRAADLVSVTISLLLQVQLISTKSLIENCVPNTLRKEI